MNRFYGVLVLSLLFALPALGMDNERKESTSSGNISNLEQSSIIGNIEKQIQSEKEKEEIQNKNSDDDETNLIRGKKKQKKKKEKEDYQIAFKLMMSQGYEAQNDNDKKLRTFLVGLGNCLNEEKNGIDNNKFTDLYTKTFQIIVQKQKNKNENEEEKKEKKEDKKVEPQTALEIMLKEGYQSGSEQQTKFIEMIKAFDKCVKDSDDENSNRKQLDAEQFAKVYTKYFVKNETAPLLAVALFMKNGFSPQGTEQKLFVEFITELNKCVKAKENKEDQTELDSEALQKLYKKYFDKENRENNTKIKKDSTSIVKKETIFSALMGGFGVITFQYLHKIGFGLFKK